MKQARLGQDESASATLPGIHAGVTEGATALESVSEERMGGSVAQDEEPGPSHSQPSATESDVAPLEIIEEFVSSWLEGLDHEDKKSLAMTLCFVLVKELSFTETRAAELTAKVIKKNDKLTL